MKKKRTEPLFYANVPISTAQLSPETEIVPMNGFVWCEDGLRVSSASINHQDPKYVMRKALNDALQSSFPFMQVPGRDHGPDGKERPDG